MSIFKEVSKHAAYISLKLGKLKKDTPEYDATQSTKEAILALGKELAISTGTNSPTPTEKLYKSRPIPVCKAIKITTDQTISNEVNTAITFNKNILNDLTRFQDKSAKFHSETTNNDRFYAHEEGKYIVSFGVRYSPVSAGLVVIGIYKYDKNNASIIFNESSANLPNASYDQYLYCGGVVYMFPGEYLQGVIYQSNTATNNGIVRASTESWQPTFFDIAGPIGGSSEEDVTTHFRPSSNAVPRTSDGGGGSGTTQTRPMCKVYHSSNQSIANATPTILSFNSEDFDIGSMHSTSSNTSRITIGVTGKYMIGATICFTPSVYTFLEARLIKNGVVDPFIDIDSDENGSGAGHSRRRLSILVDCTAGDYFEVQVYQVTGAALNVDVHANYSPRFWAYLVSALYVE